MTSSSPSENEEPFEEQKYRFYFIFWDHKMNRISFGVPETKKELIEISSDDDENEEWIHQQIQHAGFKIGF